VHREDPGHAEESDRDQQTAVCRVARAERGARDEDRDEQRDHRHVGGDHEVLHRDEHRGVPLRISQQRSQNEGRREHEEQ
jgi:hypothetical protein